jgi:hypothetical protein
MLDWEVYEDRYEAMEALRAELEEEAEEEAEEEG